MGGISNDSQLMASTSRLSSGLPATRAAPDSPPFSSVLRASTRSPPLCFFSPWHLKHRADSSGRIFDSKNFVLAELSVWLGGDVSATADVCGNDSVIETTIAAVSSDEGNRNELWERASIVGLVVLWIRLCLLRGVNSAKTNSSSRVTVLGRTESINSSRQSVQHGSRTEPDGRWDQRPWAGQGLPDDVWSRRFRRPISGTV